MSTSGDGGDEIASRGPFSLIAGDYGALIEFFERFTDLFDVPSLVTASAQVLELPPEERFTRSIDAFKQLYGIDPETSIEDVDRTDVDEEIRTLFEQFGTDDLLPSLFRFLGQQIDGAQGRLLDRLVAQRTRADEYLVAIVLHRRYRTAIQVAEEGLYRDELTAERISPMVAVLSWLVLIAAKERTRVTGDLLRDLVRAEYYLERLEGNEPEWDPESLSRDEVAKRVRTEGAVVAYDQRELSVSRGAELADCSRREFENALVRRGVTPRYGPDDVDGLLDGPGFSKSS